ncbi:MAG: hypothetical protein P9M13_05160 [Candidatus Ancaeobacter aquaticus]|nr:hypothetical protein [Candidatus Ancaeobacter aquaticus]
MKQQFLRDKQGFSVIEALITSVTLIVVGSIIIYALAAGINGYIATLKRENTFSPLRNALTRIEKDIREVATLKDVHYASRDMFTFKDIHNKLVEFTFNKNAIYLNKRVLVSGISGGRFTYYDSNGKEISEPSVAPNPTDLRFVGIEMQVSGKNPLTLKTVICPRTLRK